MKKLDIFLTLLLIVMVVLVTIHLAERSMQVDKILSAQELEINNK